MARERGPHKKCLNPNCPGKEPGFHDPNHPGNGGTYDPAIKNCWICDSPYDKNEYQVWSIPENDDSADADTPKQKINFKEMFTMSNFKKYVLPVLGFFGALICLIFSIATLPFFMGSLAIICVIGALLGMIGAIFVLISRKSEARWINVSKNWICAGGLFLFLIALIVSGGFKLANSFVPMQNQNYSAAVASVNPQNQVVSETNDAPTTDNSISADSQSALAKTANTTDNGINQPSETKFLVHAGDVISGDICIADGTKDPLYDNYQKTADIIRFNTDTYVYSEWGCYWVKNCTDDQYNSLVEGKQLEGYTVREIVYPAK